MVRQHLAAGLLDELFLHIAPVLLGSVERLLEEVGDPTLEAVEVVHSPRPPTFDTRRPVAAGLADDHAAQADRPRCSSAAQRVQMT